MACRIFPKLSDESLNSLASKAEAKFYKACRDQLPSDFLVLHSLSMIFEKADNGGHAIGESDFVIFNPSGGVLVVEVKGGGVRYEPERGSSWFSIDFATPRDFFRFYGLSTYFLNVCIDLRFLVFSVGSSHFRTFHFFVYFCWKKHNFLGFEDKKSSKN